MDFLQANELQCQERKDLGFPPQEETLMPEFTKGDPIWYSPPLGITLPKDCTYLRDRLAGTVVSVNRELGTVVIGYLDHGRHEQQVLVNEDRLRRRQIG